MPHSTARHAAAGAIVAGAAVAAAPAIVGAVIGCSSLGPTIGGMLTTAQAAAATPTSGLVAGGTYSVLQSFVMGGVSSSTIGAAAAAGAALPQLLSKL